MMIECTAPRRRAVQGLVAAAIVVVAIVVTRVVTDDQVPTTSDCGVCGDGAG